MNEKERALRNIYLKMTEYVSQADMAEKRLVKRITRLKMYYPKTERYMLYTEENGWKVIQRLRNERLINERKLAERMFQNFLNKKDGLRVIKRKMLQRDLNDKIIDSVIEQFRLSEQELDLTRITELAVAKYKKLLRKFDHDRKKNNTVVSRMYTWLTMRGFDSTEIKRIIAAIKK